MYPIDYSLFIHFQSPKAKKERKERKEKPEKQTKAQKKKDRDPNKPKKPPTAYFLWLGENRNQIKEENPGIKITEIAKKAGELWRGLDSSAKQVRYVNVSNSLEIYVFNLYEIVYQTAVNFITTAITE